MNPTLTIIRDSGVKAFRDIDLYSFFIMLLYNSKIKKYFISKKIDETILSFMSEKFRNNILTKHSKIINISESIYITVNILHKINEPMNNVFTEDYLKILNNVNV